MPNPAQPTSPPFSSPGAAPGAPIAEDGYVISETISSGPRATVYRALRTRDQQPVILKVLTPRYTPQQLERLQNEHEIGKQLGGTHVVPPIAGATVQGRPALVFEDVGGQALSGELGAPLDIGRFLRLAIAITEAVAEIHQHNVIHKDLKPGNILVRDDGRVLLADFGIASLLPAARQAVGGVRSGVLSIEGSLPYLSPEQTGRTNRVLDQRSDLYSLGVTFFEMLTGKLPFSAGDPIEWVHCHLASRPTAPATLVPSVPGVLSALVLKLLAKEAEDRYQSARGLRHDLALCLERWESTGQIEGFPLGERDLSDQFHIPQRLYGRDREIAMLRAGWERTVSAGTPGLALVSGYAGIGKSSLVLELQKPQGPIVRQRGLFAAGKFDQYKREIPYATFVQACTDLVLEILADSDAGIAGWRAALSAALGVNAQLMIDVIPQLELLLGPQPPVPAVPPAESQNRFRFVFRQFIAVFATEAHPLALFLDDLQWADPASLVLLEDLVTQPGAGHLFVIGAYRDNEVSASHPLSLSLYKIRAAKPRVLDVVLGPLPPDHLAAFIRDVLRCRAEDAAPLAALIGAKTGGNPFFAIQFLATLHDERLIDFDAERAAWRWDMAAIHGKGFTDNVVALMVSKLLRLSPGAQEALRMLACLGAQAEVATLAIVLDRGDEALDPSRAITEASRAGLVVRQGDVCRFLHDRVQEAAYSGVDPGQRPALHLRIGRLLLAEFSPEELDDRLFEVVDQLNRGRELIIDRGEKARLARLNLRAGEKAKAAIAYAAARDHFAIADALLPADAMAIAYEETFNLRLALAECEYLLGNFEAADRIFEPLLAAARSDVDRARIHILHVKLLEIAGRFADGLRIAREALALFGVAAPSDPAALGAALQAEIAAVKRALAERSVPSRIDAPLVGDPAVAVIFQIFVDYLPCAFNTGSPDLPFYILRVLNLCLAHGHTKEACFAYSASAMVFAAMLGDVATAGELSTLSLALNQRFGDRQLRGTLLFLHGAFVNFWRRPFATSAEIFDRALIACLEVGDFVYVGYNVPHAVFHAIESGETLAGAVAASTRARAILRQTHNDVTGELLRQYEQFAASLAGRTAGPASFDGDGFSEAACVALFERVGAVAGIFIYNLLKEVANFIYERNPEALASARAADALVRANLGTALASAHRFFHALILAANYPSASVDEQAATMATLHEIAGQLAIYRQHGPDNFAHRHLLVSAEIARLEGRALEAMQLYEEAIRAANAAGARQYEALACELCARFHRARGFDRVADVYLREARASYARWGADGKVKDLDRRHPELRERGALTTSTSTLEPGEIDLLAVVKASQAISGEIVRGDLLGKLMEVVIAQAGAEKGYLIVRRERGESGGAETELSIEAEARVDERGAVAVGLRNSEPVAGSPLVPASIVNYVLRTRAHVRLENAAAPGKSPFATDPYVLRTQPKAILCLPILRKGEPIGLFYLENDQLAGAFAVAKLEVLELLASQAAISLEHALLLAKERAARAEAQEALRLREQFLTVASHELRTPMTSLTLALQTLQGQAHPNAPPARPGASARLIELASRQAQKLNRLIDELLEVSRIQSGRLSLDLGEVDLAALVRDAVKQHTPELARAQCSVTLHGSEPVKGNWDRARLLRVVDSLLSNAVKFGDGKPIEVSTGLVAGKARLSVKDFGIGIAAGQQAHIFERFGRAVSEEHYGGLGLGLFICQRIVEAHGGQISVRSAEGAGAEFIVELPVA